MISFYDIMRNILEGVIELLVGSNFAFRMCLAPFICSLDVVFLDKGTTANDFAQI
jgi:hypothetical protein